MIYSAVTDIGLERSENQDFYLVGRIFDGCVLAVVCDGMGGAAGGSVASEKSANIFYDEVSAAVKSYINSENDISSEIGNVIDSIMIKAAENANRLIFNKSKDDESLSGMGTTLVAALCIGKYVFALNIGDSRLYKLSSDGMTQITHDHSYVQKLLDIQMITEEQAAVHPKRNIITKAIGTFEDIEPDTFRFTVKKGDSILLCSDGLWGYVDKEKIISAIKEDISESEKTEKLADLADMSGGHDNMTAVLVTY